MAPSAQPAGNPRPQNPIETKMTLEGFANIARAWSLDTEEQLTLLGSPPRSTYFKWKKEGGVLPKDTLERISHILNIYRVLQIVIPNTHQADKWMKEPNTAFDNETALDRALRSFKDLVEVRQYLDAQRG